MLKKAISVALLSGFIAGLFVTVIQSVLVTPLILEAESYEQSASAFQLPDSGEKIWRLIGHEWKHDEGEDSAEWFPVLPLLLGELVSPVWVAEKAHLI